MCVYKCVYIYIYIYIYIYTHIYIHTHTVNRRKKIIYMYCRYTQREVRKAVKSALALCNYAELTVHANCHHRRESGKMPSTRNFCRVCVCIYIYMYTRARAHMAEKFSRNARNKRVWYFVWDIKPACFSRLILPYEISYERSRVRASTEQRAWRFPG